MHQGLNDLQISPKFSLETALKIEKKDKVLFLGEGNFSFSKSVVELQNNKDAKFWEEYGKNVYATCYQTEEEDQTELRDKNISYLKQRSVNILFKVDGRKLNTHNVIKNIKFTKIVFMFPHVGGKMKINLNRDLLVGIFENAYQVLDNNGTLLITLCAGQGGSPFETKIRRNDDTWKILEISQDAGFVLSHILNFDPQLFVEYCQVGYRSQQKGFNVEESVVHLFKYKPLPELQPLHSMQDQTNYYALKSTAGGVDQLYPLVHEHHLSFWCRHNQLLTKEQLLEVARLCLGDIVHSINLSDEYKNSEGDISQTIIVTYKSIKFPLGPKHAFHLHYKVLGKSVCNIFRVELR